MAYDSIFRPGLFAGQTILVTGGGSGIGRCTAHELAALGAHVVLVGRKAEKLEKTAGEIGEDGGSASWHACDIRDEDQVAHAVSPPYTSTSRCWLRSPMRSEKMSRSANRHSPSRFSNRSW